MKLGWGYNFSRFFHFWSLCIENSKRKIGVFQAPHVDFQGVSWDECFLIGVKRNWIDEVAVSIGEASTWLCYNHIFHQLEKWHTKRCYALGITNPSIFFVRVVIWDAIVVLRNFPQLNCHIVVWKKKITGVYAFKPSNFVNFQSFYTFNLQL